MKEMTETGSLAAAAASNLPELTVSELAQAVKRTVERDFDRVRVRGELCRVLIANSGHL
jgi:exodeoxyribonuclease VII large subunit